MLDARIPSLSSFLPTLNPGASFSTMNAVMPLYPALASTVAKTINTPASFALLIHSFRPFSRYSSPRFSARVCSANASEPAPASLSAYAPTVSEANRGK